MEARDWLGHLAADPASRSRTSVCLTVEGADEAFIKTMAGLLDVWRHIGSTQARDVLLSLAGWVDTRTSRLSGSQMQAMLGTEFEGAKKVSTRATGLAKKAAAAVAERRAAKRESAI